MSVLVSTNSIVISTLIIRVRAERRVGSDDYYQRRDLIYGEITIQHLDIYYFNGITDL
jgi:hypothetical protein